MKGDEMTETVVIRVEELTRMKLKVQAVKRGMTMLGYVKYLANEDRKQINKGK